MPDEATIRTVGQLKEQLAGLRDDLLVVLSEDEEGNGFSPLADVTLGKYAADSTWSGQYFDAPTIPARADEDQPPADAVDVVCLWPTN